MKKIKLISLLFLLPTFLLAQTKYYEPITDSVKTATFTYATKNGETLDLDVYTPTNVPDIAHPTLLYVHGGGFHGGKRDGENTQKFCNHLAKYGYVVVSMSYRLTRKGTDTKFGCDCPAVEKIATFNAAMEDIHDATLFLVENREHLKIDPQKLALAGSSAGAEATLFTAYQPPHSEKFSYAGVIGMAGAIPDTSIITAHPAVPALLFHGTEDNLVPYATAPHHYCEKDKPGYLILHGSETIAKKLKKTGIPYWLHTTEGGRHELAQTPLSKYFNEIVEFLHTFVIKNNGTEKHTLVSAK